MFLYIGIIAVLVSCTPTDNADSFLESYQEDERYHTTLIQGDLKYSVHLQPYAFMKAKAELKYKNDSAKLAKELAYYQNSSFVLLQIERIDGRAVLDPEGKDKSRVFQLREYYETQGEKDFSLNAKGKVFYPHGLQFQRTYGHSPAISLLLIFDREIENGPIQLRFTDRFLNKNLEVLDFNFS